jgi:hypothetical protein
LGAGRSFFISILTIGLISTIGTVIMTAVPYSISVPIHKMGIPLYFFGVVILQSLIGIKELSLNKVPKVLAWLSFLVVIIFFIFATLAMLQGKGLVDRNMPVIWEWLAFFVSIIWVFAQSILLSRYNSEN